MIFAEIDFVEKISRRVRNKDFALSVARRKGTKPQNLYARLQPNDSVPIETLHGKRYNTPTKPKLPRNLDNKRFKLKFVLLNHTYEGIETH